MSEYCYEIDKYIVGVDNNGEDGIGLTIATMKDNELHILGSCYGDNARFIDLLIKENQSLKKQLEGTNEELELVRCDLHNRTSERNGYYRNIEILENQQKEFIEYMNKTIEELECDDVDDEEMKAYLIQRIGIFKEILQKYKIIIGDDK